MRLRVLLLLENARLMVGAWSEICELRSHVASEHLRLMMLCVFITREKKGEKSNDQIAEPHVFSILACIKPRMNNT